MREAPVQRKRELFIENSFWRNFSSWSDLFNLVKDSAPIPQVNGLRKQLESAEQRAANLEKDKIELLQRKTAPSADDKKNLDKTASEMLQLRTRLHEIQSTNEELKVNEMAQSLAHSVPC